jgi:NADH dehydrogenase (ubiquinone) 1 beta subcomplex subunit 8
MGYGDYPELPNISGDSKDPFYPWDNPELKRNFNEPVSDKL